MDLDAFFTGRGPRGECDCGSPGVELTGGLGGVVVYIPEYVVRNACVQLLHNQTLGGSARLLFQCGVLVTSVPWQLQSSQRSEQAE